MNEDQSQYINNYPQPQAGVWPPPAEALPVVDAAFPFKFLYMRVTGLVSDARKGDVIFLREGIIIRGQAAPVSEVATPVRVASFVFCHLVGLVIADLILQYACLRPIEWYLPWSDVKQIVFDAKKPRAGIVYDFPDRRGRIRTFTLVGSFLPAQFEQLKSMAQAQLGTAADVGKLKSGTSIFIFVFVLVLILTIVGVVIYVSLNQSPGSVR